MPDMIDTPRSSTRTGRLRSGLARKAAATAAALLLTVSTASGARASDGTASFSGAGEDPAATALATCDVLTKVPSTYNRTLYSLSRILCTQRVPMMVVAPRMERKKYWWWEDVSYDPQTARMYAAMSMGETVYHYCTSGKTHQYRARANFEIHWMDGRVSRTEVVSSSVQYTCP